MVGKTNSRTLVIAVLAAVIAPLAMGQHSSAAQNRPLQRIYAAQPADWLESIKQPANVATDKPAPAAQPVTALAKLGGDAGCLNGSQLSVVAHQDDDILFMNPDLQQSIRAGVCSRTVFVTAGDNGSAASYWQERERGPDAAYAAMYGVANNWISASVQLNGRSVIEHRLVGVPQVSLVYLRLPDGAVNGSGFLATGLQSLQRLESGIVGTLETVDGNTTYTQADIVTSLRDIIVLDKPQLVNAQAESPELAGSDHSDHQVVGRLTKQARLSAGNGSILRQYMAYPMNGMPDDLAGPLAAEKQAVFTAYSMHDSQACGGIGDCAHDTTYFPYFSRQYQRSGSL